MNAYRGAPGISPVLLFEWELEGRILNRTASVALIHSSFTGFTLSLWS